MEMKIRYFLTVLLAVVFICAPVYTTTIKADETVLDTSVNTDETISGNSGQTALRYSAETCGGNLYAYENYLTDTDDDFRKIFNLLGEKCEEFLNSEAYAADLTAETAKLSVTFEASSGFEIDDAKYVGKLFICSNPKYYWLAKSFTHISGESETEQTIVLKVDEYYYKYEARKAVDDAIASLLPGWVNQVKAELSRRDAYYAALLAHDIIIRNTDYTYNSSSRPETAIWAHSIAGLFTGQGSVCEGYALAYEYLLNLAGIPNAYIIGSATSDTADNHAWNAVKHGDKWYLCDVTWDDPNTSDGIYKNSDYAYFFVPASAFNNSHQSSSLFEYGKTLDYPEASDDDQYYFFKKFSCYSETAFDDATGYVFAQKLLADRYYGSDYIYIACAETPSQSGSVAQSVVNYVVPQILQEDERPKTYSFKKCEQLAYYNGTTQDLYVLKLLKLDIKTPAVSITLDKTEVNISAGEAVEITATLPEGSDDRVTWNISCCNEDETQSGSAPVSAASLARLTVKNNKATVIGLKSGQVLLTATAYSSSSTENPITKSCLITIEKVNLNAVATIWQNGTKDYKKVTLKTSIKPLTWSSDNGKVKTGKMVWLVSDTPVEPVINDSNHTISLGGSKSQCASISNKGVLTAKKAGTVYVYACETGQFTYEEIIVNICAAPSKLYLTDVPDSTDKEDILKKHGVEAGNYEIVYITPFIKDGTVDANCTYTVSIPKTEQKKYATVSEVMYDDKGFPYFTITGIDFDRSKKKPASVKVEAVCRESGKKASMTALVYNPVGALMLSNPSGSSDLSEKKNSVTYKLNITTPLDGVPFTTDKIKIYIGKTSVTTDENKVLYDKGATVKAKFDQKTCTLTLKASKDAGTTAVIYAALTNPVDKSVFLIKLATVDEKGIITLK